MIKGIAASIVIAAPVSADPLWGEWCRINDADMHETMYIDSVAIGFNEHTICDVDVPPALSDAAYASAMACRNVHVIGDLLEEGADPLTTHETPLPDIASVSIRLIGADRAALRLNNMQRYEVFDRCTQ